MYDTDDDAPILPADHLAAIEAVKLRMKEMTADYVRDLPEKLQALEDTWQALMGRTETVTTLETLYRQLHKLAGSAATFGFPKVTEVARRLELQLQPYVLAKSSLPEDLIEVVRHELNAIAHAAGLRRD